VCDTTRTCVLGSFLSILRIEPIAKAAVLPDPVDAKAIKFLAGCKTPSESFG
jgi:hypothetical protein